MLLCWLDVKRPCVLYQNGEESSEQTRVSRPRWADKGSACSRTILLSHVPSNAVSFFTKTLSLDPAWCTLLDEACVPAVGLVDSSTELVYKWRLLWWITHLATWRNGLIIQVKMSPRPWRWPTFSSYDWLVTQVILIVGSTSAALTTLGSFPVPCSLHPYLFLSEYNWFAALGVPLSPNQSIS